MNYIRKVIVLSMICLIGILGSTIYAAEQGFNVTVQSEQKNGKTVEYLASEDGYISRITQPNKINMTTFESKINLMGEALYPGTEIKIEVYNAKTFIKGSKTPHTYNYDLGKVGATKTFNQLLDLTEGENKIIVHYTLNKVEDKMVFYITRESEQNKQQIKNYIVFPSVKITQ